MPTVFILFFAFLEIVWLVTCNKAMRTSQEMNLYILCCSNKSKLPTKELVGMNKLLISINENLTKFSCSICMYLRYYIFVKIKQTRLKLAWCVHCNYQIDWQHLATFFLENDFGWIIWANRRWGELSIHHP